MNGFGYGHLVIGGTNRWLRISHGFLVYGLVLGVEGRG